MTPAPDTGRTAEKMRERIASAAFDAYYGPEAPNEHPIQGMWERVADALLAGPLANLIADNENLRSRLLQAEKGAEAMREACLKAAIISSYGPPSSWPGPYPKGWRHPPCWEPDQRPTPDQAAWHDNGARDAWFAIRALAAKAAPLPDSKGDRRESA